MSIRDQFVFLCGEARTKDELGSGSVSDFEPSLVRLAAFCRSVPADQYGEIEACIVSLARGDIIAPYEATTYLAHALRPKSVVDALRLHLRSIPKNSRAFVDFQKLIADYTEALSDDWEERILWTSLQSKPFGGLK